MQSSPFSRDTDMTLETITTRVRHQLDADCDAGLIAPRPGAELDRIAARSVASLWDSSRIKTYLPILALRHARNEIHATDNEPATMR
ncbi:MAG TPA: hypothetical protein VM450_02965 [Thermomicrobiales bacterium]|nr:hypothetical protein [Thermomicrobiales bacterium]